jgi:hypothetical protein
MLADLTSDPFIGLWVVLWYLIFAIFIVSCLRKGHSRISCRLLLRLEGVLPAAEAAR